MRSVVVVFPASMWAMMPMFLQRSNGTVLGTALNSFWGSENLSLVVSRSLQARSPKLVAAFFLQLLQRLIKNALGSRLLSLPHHRVDELRHQIRSIHGIRLDRPLWGMSFSWHSASSSWLLASS